MTLSPTQKKILYVGIPVVVVLVLYAWYKNRNATSTAAASTTASGSTTATSASDTAVGLGQLASFENAVMGQLQTLGTQLQNITPTQPAGTTSPTPQPVPNPPQPGATATVSESVLDASVGQFTGWLGHGANLATILAKAPTVAAAQPWATPAFAEQEVNIGLLTQGLKNRPTTAQIQALGTRIAGGAPAYSKLSPLAQQQADELANISLFEQLNPQPAA